MSENYPSDVTDEQWQTLRKRLPKLARLGRPPIERRWIVNAVLYVNRPGCQWRSSPHDFPKWKTVYTIFRRWRLEGTWQPLTVKKFGLTAGRVSQLRCEMEGEQVVV